jgi:hypothetical protein
MSNGLEAGVILIIIILFSPCISRFRIRLFGLSGEFGSLYGVAGGTLRFGTRINELNVSL